MEADNSDVVYYCLIISAAFLREFDIDVEQSSFCANVADVRGISFFEKIIKEFNDKSPYYQAVLKGEIVSYMAYLCRNYVSERKVSVSNDRIKRGLVYIREHFTDNHLFSVTWYNVTMLNTNYYNDFFGFGQQQGKKRVQSDHDVCFDYLRKHAWRPFC